MGTACTFLLSCLLLLLQTALGFAQAVPIVPVSDEPKGGWDSTSIWIIVFAIGCPVFFFLGLRLLKAIMSRNATCTERKPNPKADQRRYDSVNP